MGIEQDFDKKSFLKEGALFGKEGQIWLLWGKPQISSIRPQAVAVSVSNFFEDEEREWKLFPFAIQLSYEEASKTFNSSFSDFRWQDASLEKFRTQFNQIQEWIKSKRISKAVPYTFETSDQLVGPLDIESMIRNALSQRRGFFYGSWSEGEGVLGLSPEILISQTSSRHFKTMALAGTTTIVNYEKSPNDFLEDPKESAEHLTVVEDIAGQLGKFGTVNVAETDVLTTPHLAHLHTSIELETKRPWRLENLVESLHPTPALGCSPRSESRSVMKLFNDLEPRGVFGAPFGFSLSAESADFIVAIRNIIWTKSGTKLGAGCGVIEESEFEKEWLELTNKRNSVKKIFGVE